MACTAAGGYLKPPFAAGGPPATGGGIVCRGRGHAAGCLPPVNNAIGWMRSHILQLLGCICEFEMLHAYLMLWRLKITDLAGCVQAGWLAEWLAGSTIPLNQAWRDASE